MIPLLPDDFYFVTADIDIGRENGQILQLALGDQKPVVGVSTVLGKSVPC